MFSKTLEKLRNPPAYQCCWFTIVEFQTRAGVVYIQTVVLVRDIFTVWWRVTHKDTILIPGFTILLFNQ